MKAGFLLPGIGDKQTMKRIESIYRAICPGAEIRADNTSDGSIGTLFGYFSRFNEPTLIDSQWEGKFIERVAPGAFAKTIQENRDNIRVLYDHGKDPSVGNKPLGPLRAIGEDEHGAYYDVPLLDTSYNRDLMPAIKAGVMGASFRFKVVRESFVERPKRSAENPDGLPERTIQEAKLYELGPVTFPAYSGATAEVRSLTDEYFLRGLTQDPERLAELLERERQLRDIHKFAVYISDRSSEPRNVAVGDVEITDGSVSDEARDITEPEPSEAATPETREEPEPSGATTTSEDSPSEPEPPGATTRTEPGAVKSTRFKTREEWLEWISRT